MHFVKGPVEETIPPRRPSGSPAAARHRLVRVDPPRARPPVPALAPSGVLIIDDYGHWAGARQAVDEFFAGRPARAAAPGRLHRPHRGEARRPEPLDLSQVPPACPLPSPCAEYHSTTARSASSRSQRGPSRAPRAPGRVQCEEARLVRMRPRSSVQRSSPGQSSVRRSTIQRDGARVASAGPKFQPPASAGLSSASASAQVARERVEHVLPGPHRVGVAHLIGAPLSAARMASGISRSSPQSPPPITLPARPRPARREPSPKNDRR